MVLQSDAHHQLGGRKWPSACLASKRRGLHKLFELSAVSVSHWPWPQADGLGSTAAFVSSKVSRTRLSLLPSSVFPLPSWRCSAHRQRPPRRLQIRTRPIRGWSLGLAFDLLHRVLTRLCMAVVEILGAWMVSSGLYVKARYECCSQERPPRVGARRCPTERTCIGTCRSAASDKYGLHCVS